MQQAVIGYLATHETFKKDTEELDKVFKTFDKNNDGKVSKEEFLIGFKTVYPDMSIEEAEKIISEADVNNSGLIDYIEWIQATVDKKMLLSERHLRNAFNAFDANRDGNISLDEIKNFLSGGRKFKDKTWERILSEVDIDQDGHVNFNEFKEMMKQFAKQSE